jgi:ABC-type transport system substrate-binding protein
MKTISRREFLSLTGFAAGAAALAACTPQVVTQVVTQVVNQTSVVTVKETSVVNQTQVVEVTPTAVPAIVTPQGRTMPADAAPLIKQILYGPAAGERKHFDYVKDIYQAYGMNALSEPLIRNDPDFNLVPGLAESWKAGPNTTYWEFVIRKDAVWSDKTPVTSDDVVFTWAHAANPKMSNSLIWFYAPIKGVSEVSAGKDPSLITDPKTGGVRKIDDKTVRIYGEGPSADGDPCPFMPGLLSYQAACVCPKHIAEKDEEHWADNLPQISCGPYLCTEWQHQTSMTWDINPTYTGPQKSGIQKMIQYIAASNDSPIQDFLAQEADMMTSMDSPSLAVVRSNPKLNALLHFYSNFESQYVILDTFVKPLDNPKLRMALAKSIDRVSLSVNVLNGTYQAGYTMLPPSFPAYNKDTEKIQAYDVAAAQQLLADAGYKDGKDASGKQLTLEITSGNTMHQQRAVYIQDQWQKNLGIKVNIKSVEAGVWSANRSKHTMPIFIDQYEYDYVDPSNMLGIFHSDPTTAKANNTTADKWGSIRFGWYNADFDKLLDQAAIEADIAKRMAMYQQAEVIQCTDAALIFITHQVIFQIWWPWIVGIPGDKNGNVVYRPFDLSQYQMYVHKDVDALRQQYKGIA